MQEYDKGVKRILFTMNWLNSLLVDKFISTKSEVINKIVLEEDKVILSIIKDGAERREILNFYKIKGDING